LLSILLIGALGLLGVGLAYFVFIGVRALYRSAKRIASDAGHGRSAGPRAILRMAVWAAFFGIYYGFLYFLGRRMGWWALIPGAVGGVAMILSLLQTDRLLTVQRAPAWQQLGMAFTVVLVIAAMIAATWVAAVGG
jgi:hypothetical protein